MDFENILAKRWNEILSISSYFFDIHTAAFMDPFSIYEFTVLPFYRARVRHADFTLLRFYRFTARAVLLRKFYHFTVLPFYRAMLWLMQFTVLPFYRFTARLDAGNPVAPSLTVNHHSTCNWAFSGAVEGTTFP